MRWLDNNSLADKAEYEHHLKELQRTCSPLMTKLHGGSGGGGSGGRSGGNGRSGPTVEEVD